MVVFVAHHIAAAMDVGSSGDIALHRLEDLRAVVQMQEAHVHQLARLDQDHRVRVKGQVEARLVQRYSHPDLKRVLITISDCHVLLVMLLAAVLFIIAQLQVDLFLFEAVNVHVQREGTAFFRRVLKDVECFLLRLFHFIALTRFIVIFVQQV